MASLVRLQVPVARKLLSNTMVLRAQRCISTSKKPRDQLTDQCPVPEPEPWVSYGFDYESQKEDTDNHHASYFFSVSLCLVFGGFGWMYAPDVHMRDWAQREAFLKLRERENRNAPLIDPNYVPRSKVVLPTESQACDIEIII